MRRLAPLLLKDASGAGMPRTADYGFHFDVKDLSDDGSFEGYASVWNVVDQGGDCVQPGAFTKGLVQAKADGRLIPMLWQHDRTSPIGVWVDVSEDTKGLYVKGRLIVGDGTPQNPGVERACEAYALLKAKAIGGLSIGYRVPMGGAEEDTKRRGVWLLKTIDLVEISLVTIPMLTQAKVTAVKNLLDSGKVPTVRELEGFLREAGFPRELAKGIASKATPLLRRDVEEDGGVKSFASALEQRFAALVL